MVRTGYVRWEVEVADRRCPGDPWSGEVSLFARPTYRRTRVRWNGLTAAEHDFVRGRGTHAAMQRRGAAGVAEEIITLPDVGPRVFRYSGDDKEKMYGYWLTKVRRFAGDFAAEVVRAAASFDALAIPSQYLQAQYRTFVIQEILKVMQGLVSPEPTIEDELIEIDATDQGGRGLPELVAIKLAEQVFDPEHFREFSRTNQVLLHGSDGRHYVLYRKTHAPIDVYEADYTPSSRLCVVFRDPGLPPSDEVVMKYLLIRHDLPALLSVANRLAIGPPLPL